ncbi:MAG TPA: BlaI/MecI/CopY family transcriptional regulator [Candidatus Eisenbacteria bacterium]|nr:BlaI/MecI/CopY family transcriptional regulator [Candidatus Eisenbacteria bacterium]
MATLYAELGRRERQIMDILFRRGQATASEVLKDLADPPSYSSVRGMLRLLESKGHVRHRWEGPRHVYYPMQSAEQLQRKAARHVLHTFFNNSMEAAVAALLGGAVKPASAEELDRLARLVDRARRNGGRP